MKNLIMYFYKSPTAIVTILSFLIAFSTYLYQKKQNSKQKAQKIAEWYATTLIPRGRYIRTILEEIGDSEYCNRFIELKHFTSSELEDNLNYVNSTRNEFIKNFDKIDENILEKAFCQSGCNEVVYQYHLLLKQAINIDQNNKNKIFNNFVIDFLNEIEGVVIQFNCNLADEKMVYPVLHQVYLKNIKYWYYFIAQKNLLDHNRYYTNIIALYTLWNKRAINAKNNYYKMITRKTEQKKL